MIGNNTLTLNGATLIAALQMYLDSLVVDKGRIVVENVEPSGHPGGNLFTVKISEKKATISA